MCVDYRMCRPVVGVRRDVEWRDGGGVWGVSFGWFLRVGRVWCEKLKMFFGAVSIVWDGDVLNVCVLMYTYSAAACSSFVLTEPVARLDFQYVTCTQCQYGCAEHLRGSSASKLGRFLVGE